MECKSLISGLVFSFGIFAVKSGLGLSCYFLKTLSTSRAKTGVWAGFAVTYLLVFAAAGLILERFDPMRHQEAVQEWIRSGMPVHLLMAVLMMLWGVRLLGNKADLSTRSKGWLLLSVPCPVCAMGILFSLGFLSAGCLSSPWITAALLYVIFFLVSLSASRMTSVMRLRTSPESLLGAVMLVIAGYFFLSAAVIPNFADIDKIYRLACSGPMGPQAETPHLFVFAAIIAVAFLTGFGVAFHRIRRRTA